MGKMSSVNINTDVKSGANFGILNFNNQYEYRHESGKNTVNVSTALNLHDEEFNNWKFEKELNMTEIRFTCILTMSLVLLLVMIIKAGTTWNEARRLRKEHAELVGDIEATSTTNQTENGRNDEQIIMNNSPPHQTQHIASPPTIATAPHLRL